MNGFSPNLVCALILWRSGFGLLMGNFRQILTELSAQDTPIFLFPDDKLSKHQWIFTKLGMCIDMQEICFGISNGQISSNFDGVTVSAGDMPIFLFLDDNLSKCQGILTKLGTSIDMKIWFGIANGQISSMFDSYLPVQHHNGRFGPCPAEPGYHCLCKQCRRSQLIWICTVCH